MPLIERGELPLVEYGGMNEVHLKELELLNSLYDSIGSASDEEIDALFEALFEDIKEHFAYEEDLMRKSHFFAYECHSQEHKRVLKELEEVRKRWLESRDRKELKRYFNRVFKPWIVDHILTMDTVTAQWLSRVLSTLASK
jgi:hemerythrin